MSYKNHSMMFHVKLMKNQMPVLIGQIHGDFKVTIVHCIPYQCFREKQGQKKTSTRKRKYYCVLIHMADRNSYHLSCYGRIQRGDRGSGPPPPLPEKSQKYRVS